MIHIEKVKVSQLPTEEAEAVRKAEAEAVEFYTSFDKWDDECARLAELYKVAGLIVNNRDAAELSVITYFNNTATLFTDSEKEILIYVARDSCKSETVNDDMRVIKIMRWTRPVQQSYRAMRNGTVGDVVGLPAKLIEKIK